MNSYKDMTFCPFFHTCNHGRSCSRALTTEVLEKAKAHCIGVSQFAFAPSCYDARCTQPEKGVDEVL